MQELIEVEVYSHSDPTKLLDVLNAAIQPSLLEELKGNGGGDVTLSIRDPKVVADPTLLAYRNVLRVKVGGKVVGAVLIQKKTVTSIDSDSSDEVTKISGESLRAWAGDAVVYPKGGLRKTSLDQRAFNFASERGVWYDESQWQAPYKVVKWGDVEGSPWRYAPAEWPDVPDAWWVWSQNSLSSAPAGDNFFRYEFTAPVDAKYSFFVAADDSYAVYVDGQLNSQSEPDAVAYSDTYRIDVDLLAGPHVFAARVNNKTEGPAAFIAAVFTFGDPLVPTSATLVSYTGKDGDDNWKVAGYPDPLPGWSPGEIVLTLMEEAEERGVKFPLWLTPSFTATLDSYGQEWPRDLDWSFDLGKSVLDVIEQLEELSCDMWIDPETLEMHMAIERGVDRSVYQYDVDGITVVSAPVVFSKGYNLRAAQMDGVAEVKNSLIVQTSDGWTQVEDTATNSIDQYGRVEALLETGLSETVSSAVAGVVFEQKAKPEEGASYDIVAREGSVPFVDFQVGDWVLAPDDTGLSVKRRVMSIAVEASNSGQPLFSVEFDTIFKDNEDRIEKWLKKMGGGSLGGQFASAGGQTLPIGQPSITPPGQTVIRIPLSPQNLSASSAGLWSVNGEAFSEVTLTWDPVTSNTDGTETVPQFYEVRGRLTENSDATYQRFAFATTNSAVIRPFQTGEEWTFRVRAMNSPNAVSSYSDAVDHVMQAPNVPMPAPTAPVLSSNKGVLIVAWDGLLDGGVTPPPQYRYLYATVSSSLGGTESRMGATLSRDGREIYISGLTIGQEYWVRLYAVDGVGLVSDPSPTSNTILTGIDLGDLDTSIQDAIDAAQQAAIDAHSSSNLLIDSSFEGPGTENYWTFYGSGTSLTTEDPRTGLRAVQVDATSTPHDAIAYTSPLLTDEGDEYLVGAWVRTAEGSSSSDGGLLLSVAYGPTADDLSSVVEIAPSPDDLGATYQKMGDVFQVPVGARYFAPILSVVDTDGNQYLVDDFSVYKRVPESLIFDGAITAVKLSAESVTAEKVAADAIAARNIQAEAVTAGKIAAGAVTANEIAAGTITSNEIAAGTITVTNLQADVGGQLNLSANESILFVSGQVANVQDEVDATNDNLEEMQTYYQFGPDGAEISTPSSPFSLKLDNDQISMLEQGNVVSYWNAGTMYVRSFVGEEVILGNHKLEKYGSDTVVRKL